MQKKLVLDFKGKFAHIRIYNVGKDELGNVYEWDATLVENGREIPLSKEGHMSIDWALLDALNNILNNEEYD